ncbi:hypothetical protein NC651_005875 [Populus alba x Populus x berolinensis]|nr:hypothetical protein NC651_005875 [Populus alba x Populus x berolinensis]
MLSWNGKIEGEGQVDIGFRTARSLFRLTSRRENRVPRFQADGPFACRAWLIDQKILVPSQKTD